MDRRCECKWWLVQDVTLHSPYDSRERLQQQAWGQEEAGLENGWVAGWTFENWMAKNKKKQPQSTSTTRSINPDNICSIRNARQLWTKCNIACTDDSKVNIFISTSFITLVEAHFRAKARTPPAHGSGETLPSSCTLALRWAGLISQLSSCVKAGLSSSEMRALVHRDVLIYWASAVCVVRPRRLLLAAAVRQEATVQRRFEMFEMSSQWQQAVVVGGGGICFSAICSIRRWRPPPATVALHRPLTLNFICAATSKARTPSD